MSNIIEGVVEKVHTKTGQGKKGPWTKWSAVIAGEWYSFGFKNPNISEGQTLKVQYEEGQYGKDVKQHKAVEGSASQASNGNAGNSAPANSSYDPGARERGMQWGNASNVAATLICKMADVEALPLSAANSKANKAKRYDEFMELFNKLRVELFNDSLDVDRVLERVADAGNVEDNAPPALPDTQEDEDEGEDFNDEF
mgnify:CR=1 FL=1|tara:strand:+ start:648 stop:1241 length:594 start_codon:yes stop_codon:yes gene_type:complete